MVKICILLVFLFLVISFFLFPFHVVWTLSFCFMVQKKLVEACHSIDRAEDILFAVNGKKSKLFNGLLIFCDHYLSAKVNFLAAEGMRLDGEEMLFESRKLHFGLFNWCRVASERIYPLENQ